MALTGQLLVKMNISCGFKYRPRLHNSSGAYFIDSLHDFRYTIGPTVLRKSCGCHLYFIRRV